MIPRQLSEHQLEYKEIPYLDIGPNYRPWQLEVSHPSVPSIQEDCSTRDRPRALRNFRSQLMSRQERKFYSIANVCTAYCEYSEEAGECEAWVQ